MKKLMTLLAAVALVSSVQAQDRQTQEAKLLKAVNNLSRAVDRNLTSMSDRELRQALQTVREARRIVTGRGGNGGGGGGGHRQFIANVKFEDTAFLLEASDVRGFEQQCLVRAQQNRTGSIDDISVAFNFGQEVKEHTSGWWRTDAEKCSIVVKMILNEAFKQRIHLSLKQYVLTGDADGQGIFAEGNNVFELEQNCIENLQLNGSVDDLNVRLNGGPVKTSRTSGWWRSSAEVCRNAVSTVFQ